MKKISLIILIAVILYNCRTSKPVINHEPVQEPIEAAPEIVVEKNKGIELNGSWELQKLWGTDNNRATAPYLNINFEEKTFAGNAGCNTISGKFTTNENYITIDKEITSTKMACPGNIEKSFLSVLLKINKFVVNDSELELSQDDIVLLKFKRK
jgi:heat shock protein HslJ